MSTANVPKPTRSEVERSMLDMARVTADEYHTRLAIQEIVDIMYGYEKISILIGRRNPRKLDQNLDAEEFNEAVQYEGRLLVYLPDTEENGHYGGPWFGSSRLEVLQQMLVEMEDEVMHYLEATGIEEDHKRRHEKEERVKEEKNKEERQRKEREERLKTQRAAAMKDTHVEELVSSKPAKPPPSKRATAELPSTLTTQPRTAKAAKETPTPAQYPTRRRNASQPSGRDGNPDKNPRPETPEEPEVTDKLGRGKRQRIPKK
ncbi:hypothetical protein P154DRAFT_597991 [Amniculicola lignicola CBS 123094]|uniref:Uncharacterized protein n=1 Tax=Amniculicola lignicola CBS 123094 TaxID=1392246 RepID=A0A6A5WP86_9PLEO|nr:hypothetical protein P154DRAFT_597991 [Amniculicola lignicola CBS 123094]